MTKALCSGAAGLGPRGTLLRAHRQRGDARPGRASPVARRTGRRSSPSTPRAGRATPPRSPSDCGATRAEEWWNGDRHSPRVPFDLGSHTRSRSGTVGVAEAVGDDAVDFVTRDSTPRSLNFARARFASRLRSGWLLPSLCTRHPSPLCSGPARWIRTQSTSCKAPPPDSSTTGTLRCCRRSGGVRTFWVCVPPAGFWPSVSSACWSGSTCSSGCVFDERLQRSLLSGASRGHPCSHGAFTTGGIPGSSPSSCARSASRRGSCEWARTRAD